MRERIFLDRVHEGARFADRGNEVVPAAGGEMAALAVDGSDVGGQRVDAAEVVQQPAVEAVRLKGSLDRGNIERRPRDGYL